MSRQQAIKEVCAPGQPFELKPTQIRGKTCRVFVNAPLTLHDLFAENRSDLDFLVYGDERHSYSDVYGRASELAAALTNDYGVSHGDRVVIAMRNYPEWIISLFAITSIGAIAVPVNAWWNTRELDYSLSDCEPRVIIADEERLARLADCKKIDADGKVIRVRTAAISALASDDWNDVLAAHTGADMPGTDIDPDDDAIILYTSGSTGHPKGVVSSHRSIIHALLSWELDWELRSHMGIYQLQEPEHQGGMLLTIPLFHVAGCHAAMLSCIRMQRKVVCMYKWDPDVALQLVERERLTGLMATPAISGDVVRAARTSDHDLSSLIVLGGGGAPRAPEQVREINALTDEVVPATGWGMTETNAIGAGIAADDYLRFPASSGQCSAVLDFRIVDESGNECPSGESGELQVRGTAMFRGYWNRPDADAEAFDGDWFRTGDAALLNEEGFLFIVDRIKDMVIRGGENVGCGVVEAALVEHPDVLEACVYSVPDERLGEEVAATIYVTDTLTEDELRGFLDEHIAPFEIPRYFYQQTEPLPRIATGKIAKRQLRGEAIDRLETQTA
jgi:long-chain acyl-CoA synthetase